MSHRIIIGSSLKAIFQNTEVQTEMLSRFPISQCDRANAICAQTDEMCDEDFRFLTRKLNQLYTSDD